MAHGSGAGAESGAGGGSGSGGSPTPLPPPAPSTPPAGSGDPSPTPPRRLGEIAALISALAAVMGVFLGFLGLPVVFNSPTARNPAAAAPTATVTTTVTATVTAPAPEPSPSMSPGPSSTAQPGAPRTVTFDLVGQYGFDLGDDPVRPKEEPVQGENQVHWRSDLHRIYASDEVKFINDGSDSVEKCRASTRFLTELKSSELTKGEKVCVITPDHTGLITVQDIGESPQYFKLSVTVWRTTA